ncbi:uncharacterized protein LOC129744274 isoform X2 [Uranotaenia lowii]|uniref:uncharacterized protein LOC129744274 isoform X2 n=1 Tax=Uranotaenia lowii TaxID=190385 RepID=UPI00247A1672|nr:uncharacterized protein LOC129744274 isoform X2 [Uranotaenia lowii]
MVINPARSSVFYRRQQHFDFNERMQQKFHSGTLAAKYSYHQRYHHAADFNTTNSMGYGLVPPLKKPLEDEDDEFIDVIGDGDNPTMMGEPPQQLVISKMAAPPKIYYDQIEKESSDGGFFDREGEELDEDEDERNDLVIECDLDASVGSDRKSEVQKVQKVQNQKVAVRENFDDSDIVFNFTLVDTQLIPNEPTILKKTPEKHRPKQEDAEKNRTPKTHIKDNGFEVQVISPNPKAHAGRELHLIGHNNNVISNSKSSNDNYCGIVSSSSSSNNISNSKLREHLRVHPYQESLARRRSEASLPQQPPREVPISMVYYQHPQSSHVSMTGYSSRTPPVVQPATQIGNRHRSSAFVAPKISPDLHPQSVPLKATISNTHRGRQEFSHSSTTTTPHNEFAKVAPKSAEALSPENKEALICGRIAQAVGRKRTRRSPYYDLRSPKTPRAPVFLPPQFGFGTAALQHLYNSEQPLDYSKNSPLFREKYSGGGQQSQRSFLQSFVDVPKAPKPPKAAIRPQVVPIQKHPTLYRITDNLLSSPIRPQLYQREYSIEDTAMKQNSSIPRNNLREAALKQVDQYSPTKNFDQCLQMMKDSPVLTGVIRTTGKPSLHNLNLEPRISNTPQRLPETPVPVAQPQLPNPAPTTNQQLQQPNPPISQPLIPYPSPRRRFLIDIRHEIDEFLNYRHQEICGTLRLFTEKRAITLDQLFERLDLLKIDLRRDYFKLATNMIRRHGYRFKPDLKPQTLEYRLPERPQLFWDYFRGIKSSLIAGRAKRETLPTYALVVRALLDQYKDSLKHFLCANLVEEHPIQRVVPLERRQF